MGHGLRALGSAEFTSLDRRNVRLQQRGGARYGIAGDWGRVRPDRDLVNQAALNELGLPCYHMSEVIMNKATNPSRLLAQGRQFSAGRAAGLAQVFAKYTATVDNPGCCVWRELTPPTLTPRSC